MKDGKKLIALVVLGWVLSLGLTACGEPVAGTVIATSSVQLGQPSPAATSPAPGATPIVTLAPTTAATSTGSAASPLAVNWVKDGVCYEVFVRSFFDSNGDGKGDLPGLISRLDYLNDGNPNSTKSLGVNCIWLMPIAASPSYHGYDVTDYTKVNPDYGTNDDFKKLMQEARKRGIYVLTDLVINHTSVEHEWFKKAAADPKSPLRDWYIFSPNDPGYAGPWGAKAWHKNPYGEGFYYGVFDSSMPDLNFRNAEVTKQVNEITRFWLQDMGVDGFRIDAVKHLIENGQVQANTKETQDWLRNYRKFYTSLKPDAFTIGEVNGPSTELTGYYPDQLDQYFEFSLGQSLVNSSKNSQASFVNIVKDSDSKWPSQRYGSFLTNHDQTRIMSVLGGDFNKMKMAATAYLTLPGLPFIYYGEEIGMQGSKPDPDIRTPMQWTTEASGGFTSGNPWKGLNPDGKGVSVQGQESEANSLLNLYRRLIKVRRSSPALAQGNFLPLSANQYGVGAYLRQSGANTVLVVLNMSDEAVSGLKLTLDKSELAAGQYTAALLLGVNNPNPALTALTIGAGGAIKDYAPLGNLPARSAYIIELKK